MHAIIDRDLGSGIGKIAFARRDVDGFLSRLSDLPLDGDASAETADVTIAAKQSGRTTGDLTARTLDGSLPAFRATADIEFSRIRIRVRDLEPLKLLVGAAVPRQN